jgi:hypothetical protein
MPGAVANARKKGEDNGGSRSQGLTGRPKNIFLNKKEKYYFK